MKKTLLLFFLSVTIFISNAQNTCKVIVGTIGSGDYDQLILSSYSPSSGNPNWHEVLSFAWTCNVIGYPTCNYRTLMKYNLSSIPTNAVITSAKLKLFGETSGQDNGLQGQPMYGTANTSFLQQVTTPWDIASTGWSNPPGVSTNTQKTLAQSISSYQNYEIDVSDFVQSWVSDPSSNYGVMLRLQEENYYNSMIFYGGTATVPEQYRPTLEICYDVSLPIVLKNFNGSFNQGSASLLWSIVNDVNNKTRNIEILRSFDGKTFALLSNISGAHDSKEEKNYSYIDNQIPLSAKRIYYRLNIIDNNSTKKSSNILSLEVPIKNINISLSPNPAKDFVKIEYNSVSEGVSEIKVTDITGRVSFKNSYKIQKGTGLLYLHDLKVSSGTYFLSMEIDGAFGTRKFLIQK